MMGYGNGGSWIWMALGVIVLLVLIGVVVWVLIAVNNRAHHGPAPDASAAPDSGGRARSRQVLDERYARGEMTADEYTERLQTLGSDHVVAESARSGVNPLPGEPVGARGSSSVPRRPSTSP